MALKPDTSTRKRIVTTFVVIGIILAGWAGSGRLLEWFESRQPLSTTSPEELKEIARNGRISGGIVDAIRVLGSNKHYDDVVRLVANVCPKDDACPAGLHRSSGEAYLRLNQEKEGRAELAAMLSENRTPLENLDRLALAGNPDQYVAEVSTLLSGTSPTESTALEANNVAWGACLLPVKGVDLNKAKALAKGAVNRASPDEKATYLNTLGTVLFRMGNYEEAIATLIASESSVSDPFNWPFLGAAYAKMGQTAKAREWFAKLETFLGTTFGSETTNRHELLLFWFELRGSDE